MKRLLSVLFCLLACGALSAAPALAEELIISAAASLTDAFTDMEPAFEAEHPGVDVILNFASSGALFGQIEQGAPADVFASANMEWMDKAETNGFIVPETRAVFAQNRLVLCAPASNPAQVATLNDLLGDAVATISLGTPDTVPAGKYAQKALTAAGLWETLEPKFIYAESVRQVLDYLSRDEVDAGFVYETDAVKAGDSVVIVENIPLESPVTYPLAVLASSQQPDLAKEFVAFVLGDQGQAILAARGFSPAP